ncbi:arylsulfatase [uncultured Draconibacterium sp.]|uniref:arylsulfatase n=1 Tax=uncultured Draconibacterium sp. TaxID=1573823 RepID=UPI002AA6EBAD|nr:arylsulfatase [uncultured Draconibacterium sp.]
MNLLKIFAIAMLLSFALNGCKFAKGQNSRPNIILIMSDDMGYSDIGCYGGSIDTPNLDKLATDGLRFTQFYNGARCCPTRASLLTGLYPHQAGIGHMVDDKGYDGYRGDLSNRAVTIAEVLKQAGYSTYMSGKWHVTPYDPNDDYPTKINWPLQRGFDKFFGTIRGAGSFYDPASLARDNEYIVPDSGFYYTDAISDNAVNFIESHSSDKPFFMYVAYTAAHWPMQAKPEDIVKYEGRFDDGWEVLRKVKYERLKEMGIISPDWKLSDKDNIKDWEDVEIKAWYCSLMEVYAAMVDCMDQGIGKIINMLEKQGLKDNTLVFFLEDNGGCAEQKGLFNEIRPYYNDVMADEIKPMGKDERQRETVPRYTRDGRPVFGGIGLEPGGDASYLAYDRPWANASNTPFRMYKHYVHEGGIATPLIVHWPDGVKAKNEFRKQPSHIIDIMATCVDVASADYPKTYNGNSIVPMAGISLVPTFNNKEQKDRILCWEHEGNKAIRVGDYKLVSRWEKGSEYNWELYNMEADRTETNNLADEMPDKVQDMETQWKDWAKKNMVLTWNGLQHVE